MPAEPFDPALGASYELLEPIGRGGSGEVWRGRDRRSGDAVAAKLLHREHLSDEALVARFVRERSILMGLRHPNVVSVRDLVVEPDRLAIVMELVAGGSLREVLRVRGTLPPALALRVAATVLDGLAAAHDQGVRHGDVKPDNVLLEPGWADLGTGAVKLSDFGVAEIVTEGSSSSAGPVGTPDYLAPEQVTNSEVGPSADVYGVGVLLYELVGGRPPYGGGDAYAAARLRGTDEPAPLPVPAPVWEAMQTLLARDPDGRPTAPMAARWLRRLAPSLDGLPAIPVRTAAAAAPGGPPTDLGTPDRPTLVRPLPVDGSAVKTPSDGPDGKVPSPAPRRRRRR